MFKNKFLVCDDHKTMVEVICNSGEEILKDLKPGIRIESEKIISTYI